MRWARPLAAGAAAVALWWAAVAISDIRPFFLPSPLDVVEAFGRRGDWLAREAWVTLWQTLTGFVLAATAGLAAAIALALSTVVRESLLPLIVAVQAVPKVAVAPLLMLWLGFGPAAKIALVVLLSFFPVVLSALAGLTTTPAELLELARSLSATRPQAFLRIRIPWALPQIFVGLKLSLSLSLIGAVVAQITTPNAGLGAVIVRAGQSADTPLAFAAIVLLATTGISLFYLLTLVERLLLPWARERT